MPFLFWFVSSQGRTAEVKKSLAASQNIRDARAHAHFLCVLIRGRALFWGGQRACLRTPLHDAANCFVVHTVGTGARALDVLASK